MHLTYSNRRADAEHHTTTSCEMALDGPANRIAVVADRDLQLALVRRRRVGRGGAPTAGRASTQGLKARSAWVRRAWTTAAGLSEL
jgi:hypothetical protein